MAKEREITFEVRATWQPEADSWDIGAREVDGPHWVTSFVNAQQVSASSPGGLLLALWLHELGCFVPEGALQNPKNKSNHS